MGVTLTAIEHIRMMLAAPHLLAALKVAEWQHDPVLGDTYCFTCGGDKKLGHKPDCIVGAAIAKAEGIAS